ncbi:MAG: ScpA family protein [Candidatus Paceibacterota bacterium]
MSENTFQIKTEVFEGPLDLLLSLIEKKKLFINDIALSKVADDYIAYLQQQEKFPMAQSADFLVIASTLLLIKSRSLIPSLNLTEDEQQDINDLERRLKLYQQIKDLSRHIKDKFGKNIIFAPEPRKMMLVFSPDQSMTKENLLTAVWIVIKALPKVENLPKAIVKKVISLEEMMVDLTKRIQSSIKMSFREFAKVGKEERVNVIISFLAMLELVKQGIVNVKQENHFDDIEMETQSAGLPHYN